MKETQINWIQQLWIIKEKVEGDREQEINGD